jgi:ferredoxin-nitrite reductase
MSTTATDFRLDGIYRQRQEGFLMQRVKLPAGVISSGQALMVCEAADRFGRSAVHLTTRGSMEIHWLQEPDLPSVKRLLTSVGLTSRGASCSGILPAIRVSSGCPRNSRSVSRPVLPADAT